MGSLIAQWFHYHFVISVWQISSYALGWCYLTENVMPRGNVRFRVHSSLISSDLDLWYRVTDLFSTAGAVTQAVSVLSRAGVNFTSNSPLCAGRRWNGSHDRWYSEEEPPSLPPPSSPPPQKGSAPQKYWKNHSPPCRWVCTALLWET